MNLDKINGFDYQNEMHIWYIIGLIQLNISGSCVLWYTNLSLIYPLHNCTRYMITIESSISNCFSTLNFQITSPLFTNLKIYTNICLRFYMINVRLDFWLLEFRFKSTQKVSVLECEAFDIVNVIVRITHYST